MSRSLFQWETSSNETPPEFLDGIPIEKRHSVTLNFETPASQITGQGIYIARIVMNLATAYLSCEQSLYCALNAIGLAYSLLKTTQLKWLKFSREFEYPRPPEPIPKPIVTLVYNTFKVAPKKFLFSYFCPLFPNLSKESECLICLGDNPSFCFCPYSPIDETCLVTTIYNASKDFDQNLDLSFKRITEGKTVTYHAKIPMPQKNLPKCPHCKKYPSTHFIEGKYWDWDNNSEKGGLFQTTVHIIPDPSASPERPLFSETFWTRLGIIYNTFQLGLATMQHRHPELAGKILCMQRVLSLFDVGLLVQNYKQLYRTFYQRHIPTWVQQNIPRQRLENAERRLETARLEGAFLYDAISKAIEEGTIDQTEDGLEAKSNEAHSLLVQYDQKMTEYQQAFLEKEEAQKEQAAALLSLEKTSRIHLIIKMGLGVAVLTAASAGVVSLMHRLPTAIDLTDLLKKIVAPEDLGNIKASWSIPWLEYASQSLLVSKIVVNLALAFFSTHRISYLSSAFLQTLTFLKISKLSWILLERSFSYPRGPMSEEGPQSLIKTLHTSFEFFIPPFASRNPSHPTCNTAASYLESSLKTAYNYTTEFFKNNIWERYWMIYKTNGVETSRELMYDVAVKPSTLSEFACKIVPLLDRVTAWAQDAIYGKAIVNIQ